MYFIFVDIYAANSNRRFFGIKSTSQIYRALLSKDCHLIAVTDDLKTCIKLLKTEGFE